MWISVCSCIADDNESDECLGILPGIANACCGHGDAESAYVQLLDGSCIRGKNAKVMQDILKGTVETDFCDDFLRCQIKDFEISIFRGIERNKAERELRNAQSLS